MLCNFLSRIFGTASLTSIDNNYIYSNREEFKSIKKDLHLTSHFFLLLYFVYIWRKKIYLIQAKTNFPRVRSCQCNRPLTLITTGSNQHRGVFFTSLSHFTNVEIGIRTCCLCNIRCSNTDDFRSYYTISSATSGRRSCRRESGVVVCRNLPLYEDFMGERREMPLKRWIRVLTIYCAITTISVQRCKFNWRRTRKQAMKVFSECAKENARLKRTF